MGAVGCCGQPPRVVATARCRVPTAQHSTAQHSLSLPYFPSPWRRLVWAHPPRACTRTTALHLAHLGAGKRTGAQCGAAEAQCRHQHTTQPQPHTGTTLTLTTFTTFSLSLGALHGGNTVDGSAPCWGGGRNHFQNTVNTEYAANFRKARLKVVRAIFAVISSTL